MKRKFPKIKPLKKSLEKELFEAERLKKSNCDELFAKQCALDGFREMAKLSLFSDDTTTEALVNKMRKQGAVQLLPAVRASYFHG